MSFATVSMCLTSSPRIFQRLRKSPLNVLVMLKMNKFRSFVLSGAVHDVNDLHIPPYVQKVDEPLKIQKARLLYQSRKRGMLENGLLLSSFADKYLDEMTAEQVQLYDRLINLPSNDWDLFYWATGVKPIPTEFDNEIMKLFQDHVKNKDRKSRICQPDLTKK